MDDDAGFVRWRDTHPAGFVLIHDRKPRPNFLKVHRAACPTIQGARPARGGDWTRVLPKTCSDGLDDLRQWAQTTAGGELEPCAMCASGNGPAPAAPVLHDAAPGISAVVAGSDAPQLRVALRNELGWMLQAAVRFARAANGDVALQDSTFLHARKLVGFAASASARKAELADRSERWAPVGPPGEKPVANDDLARFLDDWVMHLGGARGGDVVWPIDRTGSRIANDDPARVSKVVDLVLEILEVTAADVVESSVGDDYRRLLGRSATTGATLTTHRPCTASGFALGFGCMKVEPLTATIGAEIGGVDLRPRLSDDVDRRDPGGAAGVEGDLLPRPARPRSRPVTSRSVVGSATWRCIRSRRPIRSSRRSSCFPRKGRCAHPTFGTAT